MLKYLSTAITLIVSTLIMSAPANECRAYVLSGSHILELMIERLRAPAALRVDQRVCLLETGPFADPAEYSETVHYKFPEYFRSDIETDQGVKIHVFAVDRSLTIINERITSRAESFVYLYKDILLFRNRELLESRLSFLGVNISVSSLGRHNGRICYIVGAKYPDESVPQVWFDQKTFRPCKYILPNTTNPDGAGYTEIRYMAWRKFNKTWYPERVEMFRDGILLQTIDVLDIDVKPELKAGFFDIDRLISLYPDIADDKADINGQQNDLNNVRQSIEEFRKRFEQ